MQKRTRTYKRIILPYTKNQINRNMQALKSAYLVAKIELCDFIDKNKKDELSKKFMQQGM